MTGKRRGVCGEIAWEWHLSWKHIELSPKKFLSASCLWKQKWQECHILISMYALWQMCMLKTMIALVYSQNPPEINVIKPYSFWVTVNKNNAQSCWNGFIFQDMLLGQYICTLTNEGVLKGSDLNLNQKWVNYIFDWNKSMTGFGHYLLFRQNNEWGHQKPVLHHTGFKLHHVIPRNQHSLYHSAEQIAPEITFHDLVPYFLMEGNLVSRNNIDGVIAAFNIVHYPDEWRLFINPSQKTLKVVFCITAMFCHQFQLITQSVWTKCMKICSNLWGAYTMTTIGDSFVVIWKLLLSCLVCRLDTQSTAVLSENGIVNHEILTTLRQIGHSDSHWNLGGKLLSVHHLLNKGRFCYHPYTPSWVWQRTLSRLWTKHKQSSSTSMDNFQG